MRSLRSHLLFLCCAWSISLHAQSNQTPITKAWDSFSTNKKTSEFVGLHWDALGPVINSGRIEALDVDPKAPNIIYAGFGSGNLWKTTNHGLSWKPIFDDFAGYSIGDVKIAPSNSDIVYLATGESLRAKRGHTIAGAGVYRSDDAGKTWKALGLASTHHISRITIHPTNPDIVFISALGHFYSPNEERGVYKTEDGGKTWNKVLYVDDRTGGNDVVISPTDPSIVYASTWQCSEVKAGPGSGLFKSTDGGNNWVKINNGFPSGQMTGRTGLAISQQDGNKVYAFTDNVNEGYENGSGQLYLTENGGSTWKKTHVENLKILSSFGEVFTDCFVNPNDDDEVYLLGINVLRSDDGGSTFSPLRGSVQNLNPSPSNTFHLDHHDMWINPANTNHIMVGNDGGLYISYDKGESWTQYNNVPIGEFYFVRTDNDTPYRIYSGTQDDAAVRGPARKLKDHGPDGWEYVWIDVWSGGDGIVVTPDREDSDIVYYESQNGAIRRKRMSTGDSKGIKPRLPRSAPTKLYNEWLTPFFTSSHQNKTLYYGANYMFKSTDRGDSWNVISPDLSQSANQERSGNGIIAMEESPTKAGLLYAGTSKGAAWVSQDDGANWKEISEGLATSYIKSFAPSAHQESRVYVSQSGITVDHFEAMVFRSEDYGSTWTDISSNLPDAPINVILEDPRFENVLYCGTFNGVFVSTDRGGSWKALGSNMPNTFVADMVIQEREQDLIAVTHGRGIYKIDLESLHKQWEQNAEQPEVLHISTAMLPKRDASGRTPDLSSYESVNFDFYVNKAEDLSIKITNDEGEVIFSNTHRSTTGFNTFIWDLTLPHTPASAPYTFEFVKFPQPGNYTISFSGKNVSFSKLFYISDQE